MAFMVFLNDVPSHGGRTIMWPESHKKIAALSRSNSEYYELIWTLNNDLSKIDFGGYIELIPKQVTFYFTIIYVCIQVV